MSLSNFVSQASEVPPSLGPVPLLFKRWPSQKGRTWQNLFLVIYSLLAATFLFRGQWGFAICYIGLSFFFALRVVDLDIFAPASWMAHSFGIYFLLPLAFNRDCLPSAIVYVTCTLVTVLVLYLILPRLNFGLARSLGTGLQFRPKLASLSMRWQIIGYAGFILSLLLAGYTNPLQVMSDPLQYRLFMMQGGMSYFRELIELLIIAPTLVIAAGYYLKHVSRAAFIGTTLAAMAYGLTTGSRGAPIFVIVDILVIRHLLYKRTTIIHFLLLICIAIPFISIYGAYRDLKHINANGSSLNVAASLSAAEQLQATINRADASKMFNELMAAYDPSNVVLAHSYWELPLQVIPRAFWPTKPRIPNPEMTRIIGRDDPNFDISFDFGIFGESYINFGWLGVFMGAMTVVVVVGIMQCVFEYAKTTRNPFCAIVCASLVIVPFVVVITGFVELVTTSSFTIISLLLIRRLLFNKPPA